MESPLRLRNIYCNCGVVCSRLYRFLLLNQFRTAKCKSFINFYAAQLFEIDFLNVPFVQC